VSSVFGSYSDTPISDNEIFLHRILLRPNCFVPNLISGEHEIKDAALIFDEDGMSVHSDMIREELGVPRSDLVNWDERTVIEFPASAADAEGLGQIVRDFDADDPLMGDAHGLVQGTAGPKRPAREHRKAIRKSIVRRSNVIGEDPNLNGTARAK